MGDMDDLFRRPLVYTLPGMEQVKITPDIVYKLVADDALEMNLYVPPDHAPDARLPAVIYVNGDAGPVRTRHVKDMGAYQSWGRLTAIRGLVAVTFNHRSVEGWTKPDVAASDVDDLVHYVHAHAAQFHVDADRLCLWTCSAGPPFALRTALHDRPPFVRCIVAYYGLMNLQHLRAPDDPDLSAEAAREYSPVAYLAAGAAAVPPLLVAKAGLDHAAFNDSIDQFVDEALRHNLQIDVLTYPQGHHAFDVLDDTARSREIIQRTLDFMALYLRR